MGTTATTLQTRRLGTTDLEITTVGFGAWATGGGGWAYGWGPQDDEGSIAAIRRAVDSGVNWIDTAAIYGLGHSEEVVGRALREIPAADRPHVFTKGGMVPDRGRPYADPQRTLQPASIRRELEASLRRLGVEQIDLYQFHWPDETDTPIEDSWAEMVRFVEEGKVRAIGVSNFDVALLERAEAMRHVDSLQPPFSLIRRDSGADVIRWAAAHGTGVIVYSPMQSGILTDTFSAERVAAMADDDWRRRSHELRGAGALPQRGPAGRTAPDRRTPRSDRVGGGGGMDAGVAGRDRRHRRRAHPRPGGRLDRGGQSAAQHQGSGHDQRCGAHHGSRLRAGRAGAEGDVMSTRVAVLGTGKMGSALARRLAESGFEITLWNRTRSRAEEVGVGHVAATPADAVRAADVVISSLTGPDAVRATYSGPQGALSAAGGQLFVEMSTAGPDAVARLEPQVVATGSRLVDAPILGMPPLALRGAAAILIGGATADVERVQPVLLPFGEVRHVGPLGSAARLKLVANSMLGTVTTAAAELQVAGEKAGIDAEHVFWILARLVPSLEMRRAGYLEGSYEAQFALRDLLKDLDLAIDLFHHSSADTPVAALVRELVNEAAPTAAELDISAIMTRYRPVAAAPAPAGTSTSGLPP